MLRICLLGLIFSLITTGGAWSRDVPLTIIFTTDLHGHIWPTKDYDGQANVGGFLRCAARIEALRATHTNVLLIDSGDTFQGSPESFLTGGRLLIDGLNVMRYDAWVLGNHEIDWGPANLAALHDQVEIPFLCANIHFADGAKNWLPKIKPYVMRDVDGIKVAIIGLTTPGIPRWSRPHLLDGAMFKQSVESLRDIMPQVKEEGADVIILAAHQGHRPSGDDFANQINATMAAFPEIDVYLGGHTHRPVNEMDINGVLYSQAGYHGIWLGQVDLVYDTVTQSVISRRGRVELMNDAIPFHDGLLARWQKELDGAKAALDEEIGFMAEPLTIVPDTHGQSPMQQLICRSILAGSGADMVLHGSLGDKPFAAGPVRYRDVWTMVPYENTIGVLSLTPAELKVVLAENHSRKISPSSLAPYGFRYSVDLSAPPDDRITDLRDDAGEPLEPRKRYRVAFNSYVLASGGNRYNAVRNLADQPQSRLEMLTGDTRSMVVAYIKKHHARQAEDASAAD